MNFLKSLLNTYDSSNQRIAHATALSAVAAFSLFGMGPLLSSTMPSPRQIRFWDEVLVPLSKWIDHLFRFSLGKSVLTVR